MERVMKLKPEVRTELARRRRLARAVRRTSDNAHLLDAAETVRKNNAEIRTDPFRAGLPAVAAMAFRRLQLAAGA
jgi:hypothetical protein